MRSRYSAYVLQKTAYLVETTVPSQRHLLDVEGMAEWGRSAQWLGLDVSAHHSQNRQTPCASGICGTFPAKRRDMLPPRTVGFRQHRRPLVFYRPYRAAACHEAGVSLRVG